jgi:hypothetical protein
MPRRSATAGCITRYSDFLDLRFGGDLDNAYDTAVDALTSLLPNVLAMREGIWELEVGFPLLGPGEITGGDIDGIAQAWRDTLEQKISEQ